VADGAPILSSVGLRPALAGAAATFSGIGLSRFAYVPLFPAMVSAGWVTGPEGGLLGAFNLAGYLAGCSVPGRLRAASAPPLPSISGWCWPSWPSRHARPIWV
jgi:hypothetical protein